MVDPMSLVFQVEPGNGSSCSDVWGAKSCPRMRVKVVKGGIQEERPGRDSEGCASSVCCGRTRCLMIVVLTALLADAKLSLSMEDSVSVRMEEDRIRDCSSHFATQHLCLARLLLHLSYCYSSRARNRMPPGFHHPRMVVFQ